MDNLLLLKSAAGRISLVMVEIFFHLSYLYTGLFSVQDTNNPKVNPLRHILSKADKKRMIQSLKL